MEFRKNKVIRAETARELLAEPVGLTASLGDDPMGDTWQDRVAWVAEYNPTIVQSFGMAVLTASARPRPAGSDRWLYALADATEARVSGVPGQVADLRPRHPSWGLHPRQQFRLFGLELLRG
jgi:hypothetical protein